MSQANPDKRNRSYFIILRVLFGLQGLLLLPTALEKIPTEDAFLGWIMLALSVVMLLVALFWRLKSPPEKS